MTIPNQTTQPTGVRVSPLVAYNGINLYAFRDAPGWYVYQYQLLHRITGTLEGRLIETSSYGYVIAGGPFETKIEADELATRIEAGNANSD